VIDFDLSHRPVRPSEWKGLAQAVHESTTPEESYWLETKGPLNWSSDEHLGKLAKAILGMANRDPENAGTSLDGCAAVIVGLGPAPGQIGSVEVIDAADLENKLAAFLGSDGPRWQPHWVPMDDAKLLVVEVDAPRKGDPGYTLRKRFGDYRVSQMFVRHGAKTLLASQADVDRLARRFAAVDSKETLDVLVGYTLDEPLSRIWMDQKAVDAFVHAKEGELLSSLDSFVNKVVLKDAPEGSEASPGGIQAMLGKMGQIGGFNGLLDLRPEDRTPEEFRAEVVAYVAKLRDRMSPALWHLAKKVVPLPRFWISNLSNRNFKEVDVTLSVEGRATAFDVENRNRGEFEKLLPTPPRKFGPYTVASNLLSAMVNVPHYFPTPIVPLNTTWSRREINNGGSFTLKLDRINLRPDQHEVDLESETVIFIPLDRTEDVVVHWHATASNVDAVAEGDFVLPFDGAPIELLAEALLERIEE
jgi:hypothetical protein